VSEFSPGLEGVVAAETAISEVDGANGRLIYRGGYLIEDLAPVVTFEEVAYLLWNGNLPNEAQLDEHRRRLAAGRALIGAATSGNPKYFLGTDSAPHARAAKEQACGCAGCYSAPVALPLYAEAFEDEGKLDRLEAFASFHGADFYGLPRNTATITLKREAWVVPASYPFGDRVVVPLRAGETMRWRLDA